MPASELAKLHSVIRNSTHADEIASVEALMERAKQALTPAQRSRILTRSRALVARCRESSSHPGALDAFLQEFGLTNPEGVALMCLAEALLRIPDETTADKLIAEKIRAGDWQAHLGKSRSHFVNASVWGLMLTGRLVKLDSELATNIDGWMHRLVNRLGEPVVRTAVIQAMRILARQFVLGRTIDEALQTDHSQSESRSLYSFDMLGEGARTWSDAEQFYTSYSNAIDTIGLGESTTDPKMANGISLKLSALHPRYEEAQRDAVLNDLGVKLLTLAMKARSYGLGFSIDAEEASRLDLSLSLFETLARSPELNGWNGLGFVLQAYQKRAPAIADWLISLGLETRRQLMVRLVKGAYWDAEIKHAQEQGFADYPVFTRKTNTDLSFEVCATRLLQAPRAIYPQFATHNAATVCQVIELAGKREYEFQRLHGMGQLLYDELFNELGTSIPLRIYAPVGSHRDLLPYLVRRLLENGANSSFINRFLDARTPIDELVQDVLFRVRSEISLRHPEIPRPADIYRYAGELRENARGIDLSDPQACHSLLEAVQTAASRFHTAAPIVDGVESTGESEPVLNPADGSTAGCLVTSSHDDVDRALDCAQAAQPEWDWQGSECRAAILERAACLLDSHRAELMALIGTEAGRTVADAQAEVREAVDFCRYYALQARRKFENPTKLPGPTGEHNELSLHGRGVFACISPWNFPLAIFIGQITAALAAGNCVIAKPAEQTPLTGSKAVRLLHTAGVPAGVLHFLPGEGSVIGAELVADHRVNGCAFNGGTDTARQINRLLAGREGPIVPLIAETGGQNVMLTDSSALPEQLVDDVIGSAFGSAGQRCSALRVLYLQEEIADSAIEMLLGAMATLVIGNPLLLETDVGPVIDAAACASLQAHVSQMEETERSARLLGRCQLPDACTKGTFFAPQIFEIDSINQLDQEVFGPVLHVIRYQTADLDLIIDEINATGYGLTLGIHSRIEGFAQEIFRKTRIGNTYINRNMVGAVVGVNPFGGQGLSGTGPKAGGPHYLPRFASERTRTENVVAKGGNIELFGLS